MSTEQNVQLVQGYVDVVWRQRRIEDLPRFIGGDLLEEATEHTQQFLDAFSDIDVVIEDLIAADDKVVGRLMITATHSGPFAGAPGTGKRVSFASYRIYRVGDGKIVETWAMQDRLGLLEQLGLVQSTATGVNWAGGRSSPRD